MIVAVSEGGDEVVLVMMMTTVPATADESSFTSDDSSTVPGVTGSSPSTGIADAASSEATKVTRQI